MAFVYIIKSVKSGRFYIGSTINLERRLIQHEKGANNSTRNYGEIKLIFSQEYSTVREARIIERKLKKLKRKDYLKKIVEDGFIRTKP
jgi:putative endonuclease